MEKSFKERVEEAKAAVPAVTPQEANARKTSDPNTLFIDPRGADDIRKTTGIIPGALNVSLKDLSETSNDNLPEALASRSRSIITACQGAPVGALAAHALQQRGFENVAFIDGGTQGWLDAGYATVK
jgi:rhodanese-related sulfurtransferase